jgi:aspartate 1-decarboxylase
MFANGTCARLTAVGDRVIICTYVQLQKSQLATFKPVITLLNEITIINFHLKL